MEEDGAIGRIGTLPCPACYLPVYVVIGNRDPDMIKSYRRALNPGVARIQEAATREADARGLDLNAVNCMMQEVDESTGDLLQAAKWMLQELAEEAKASWADRAVYYAYNQLGG